MRVEWLLFLALLAIGLFPFLRRASSVGTRFVVLAVLLAAGGLFAAAKWTDWRERKSFERTQFYASVPREGRPGGYVSSDKCQSCHPDQYASWHRSFHRTMTQYATPEAVRGKFEGQTLELEGQSYKFERRGDEFWVEMLDPDWKLESMANQGKPPSTPATRVWKRLGITTGSHHMQAYWVPSAKGNLQFNLPFSFLFEDQRWVPRNDTFLMDPKFPAPVQLWNANCIQCHATAGQPKPDPQDHSMVRTQLGEIGIACEACHGPAEKHVALNTNPARRLARHREGKDPTVVNPGHLSHLASSQVCGQCHSIKSIPKIAEWKYDGFKYRPGDDLETLTPIIRATEKPKEQDPKFIEERYWSDGMVRVSGREFNGLVESPCFQKGTMSCVSCHSLHESDPDDQLAKGMESNAACTQCHKDLKPNHTHHAQASSGSVCYNCHMPHTTYGLMKAIRSHQIDSPSVRATLATGRPNACNLCHLDKTLAWTAEKLTDWFGAKTPDLSQEQKTTSAAALLTLRGDAGQRALLAWHMGWKPAREASGERWLAPYLGQLLEDPYSTVRYIARRSLRTLPGFADFEVDYIGPAADRARARQSVWAKCEQVQKLDRSGPEVLIRPDGQIEQQTWQRLLSQRDDKSMYLQE